MRTRLVAAFCALALAAYAGDLEVARQALNDSVWTSALAAADLAATNAEHRTQARLLSLEALAHLEDDVEIRKRLSAWKGEQDERFRYWLAREQVRVGDLHAAKATLEKPFASAELVLPVACLKACMLAAGGDKAGALKLIEEAKPSEKGGLAGEDAQLIRGELLGELGKGKEAREALSPIAEKGGRLEVKLRAGYLLGFLDMQDEAMRTSGVARVRALLRKHPGHRLSIPAAKSFAGRLLDLGDAAGADDEYRRYLEVNPVAATDAEVLERRGQAFFRLGRYKEAAGAFARAEQVATNAADMARAAYGQADALLADGRYAEAANGYARSAKYGVAGVDRARFAEADARERAGDGDEAEKIYGELGKSGGAWGAKAKLRMAAMLSRKGLLPKAIEEYTKLMDATNLLSAADMAEVFLGRGRACYRSYRFKDAAEDFGRVAEMDAKRSDGMRFLRALCLYGDGRDVDAKAEAASLMTSTKDQELRADLMLWCGKYEYNQGDYAAARTHFETYASLRAKTPSAAEALLWAARCASAMMDYSKAVDLATQSANAAAGDKALLAEILIVQGEALMELGRYAEAVQVFDRVLPLSDGGLNAVKAAMLKADALYAMGAGNLNRYEDAIAAYRMLAEGSSLSADQQIEVAFKIGRALEKLRRPREAMDQYYRGVVLVYMAGLAKGLLFGAPAQTFFARAAFAHVDYDIAAGDLKSAMQVLKKVVDSKVPSADEARKRMDELQTKGGVE